MTNILIIVLIIICIVLIGMLPNKPTKCDHKWKCIHKIQHRIYDEPWDKYPSEKYMENIWECEKCKEIKITYYDL